MEADNPFGEYSPEIIPGERLVIRAIDSVARFLSVHREAPAFMSNHYHAEHFTGAEAMLDGELYDIPEGVVLGED